MEFLPQADHSLAHGQQPRRDVSLAPRTPGTAAGAVVLALVPQARVAAEDRSVRSSAAGQRPDNEA